MGILQRREPQEKTSGYGVLFPFQCAVWMTVKWKYIYANRLDLYWNKLKDCQHEYLLYFALKFRNLGIVTAPSCLPYRILLYLVDWCLFELRSLLDDC